MSAQPAEKHLYPVFVVVGVGEQTPKVYPDECEVCLLSVSPG